jgi:acyl-CoA thioester hydrolase
MEKEPQSFYVIRFGDCDPFGHLNNSRYIDYFLNAREDHLRENYGINLKEWAAMGIGFVVSRHEIRYLRPVAYNDRVCIRSSLIGMGDVWLQVEMQLWDEDRRQLKAIMWTSFIRVSTLTGKKETHSADFLTMFAALQQNDPILENGLDARIAQLKR